MIAAVLAGEELTTPVWLDSMLTSGSGTCPEA